MILETKNLFFSFPDKEVFSDLSFSAKDGDRLAIIGANGVGKTTLIKLLTGELLPSSGSISISGESNPFEFNRDERTLFGVMRKVDGLYLKMTGYEYLSFIAALYGMSSDTIKTKIGELISELYLKDEIHRIIGKYSEGTKKKIEFCASIIHEPKLLFLDEPFESVDPRISYQIKAHLKKYSESGGTILITSHILDIIQNICNQYIILKDGTVAQCGEISEQVNLEEIFMEVVNDE